MISFNFKKNLPAFFVIIFLINAAGYLLRYFSLDTFIVFLGFRLHISLLIFSALLFDREFIAFLKRMLIYPHEFKFLKFLLLTMLPSILIGGSLLLLKEVKIAKPENFYELGISSLIDYPIYFIWNFPNIAAILSLILFFVSVKAKNILLGSSLFFLIYLFEIIPIEFESLIYLPLIAYVLFSLTIGIVILKFRNIYFLFAVFFTSIWIWILAFGSSSRLLIKLFLASQYQSWDGFFKAGKSIEEYLTAAALLIFLFITVIISSLSKKANTSA